MRACVRVRARQENTHIQKPRLLQPCINLVSTLLQGCEKLPDLMLQHSKNPITTLVTPLTQLN